MLAIPFADGQDRDSGCPRTADYLEAVEFPYSPRVLGFDADGNEILSYIDGISGRNAWAMVVPEAGLTAFAQLLRSYHDAVEGFRPTTAGWSGHHHNPG